jgi:hypothetical protein
VLLRCFFAFAFRFLLPAFRFSPATFCVLLLSTLALCLCISLFSAAFPVVVVRVFLADQARHEPIQI